MTTTQATPRWTLGERLAKARRWAGLTPDEMAEALGRSPRSIRNYEHDTGNVPLNVLRQYAARTGVPIIWLIEGDQDPELTPKLPDSECYPAGFDLLTAA